jgi:hypothetical protein
MNRLIMKLALALLPPSRGAWGEAMMGEFAALPDGQSGFALGCLGASVRENVTALDGVARLEFFFMQAIGLTLGVLWILGLVEISDELRSTEGSGIAKTVEWIPMGLIPVIVWISALKALKDPTDHVYVNDVVTKMAACLVMVLGLHIWLTFLVRKLACYLALSCESIGGVTAFGAYLGPCILALGVWVHLSKKKKLKAPAFRSGILLSISGMFLVILPSGTLLGDLTGDITIGVLLLFMATTGTAVMLMQRGKRVSKSD